MFENDYWITKGDDGWWIRYRTLNAPEGPFDSEAEAIDFWENEWEQEHPSRRRRAVKPRKAHVQLPIKNTTRKRAVRKAK